MSENRFFSLKRLIFLLVCVREAAKKSVSPPPLSGRATKKWPYFFAASLTLSYHKMKLPWSRLRMMRIGCAPVFKFTSYNKEQCIHKWDFFDIFVLHLSHPLSVSFFLYLSFPLPLFFRSSLYQSRFFFSLSLFQFFLSISMSLSVSLSLSLVLSHSCIFYSILYWMFKRFCLIFLVYLLYKNRQCLGYTVLYVEEVLSCFLKWLVILKRTKILGQTVWNKTDQPWIHVQIGR